MKKTLLGIGIGFGVLVIIGTIFWLSLTANMKTIQDIPIQDSNLQGVQDQVVRGQYNFEDQIGATVDVTIKDGQITEIQIIEHITGKGELAELIVVDIINNQSLLVDNIAGATTSSHIIKLAVMAALEKVE